MPYVCNSLAKSVSGSAYAGAANTNTGAIAAAAIDAMCIPFMASLSDWALWVFITDAASADADQRVGRMSPRFRPRQRLRPVPHVLRPPEPWPDHRRGRWGH